MAKGVFEVSDVPRGEGWWQASDGRWYPPQDAPAPPPSAARPPYLSNPSPGGSEAPTRQWGSTPSAPGGWPPATNPTPQPPPIPSPSPGGGSAPKKRRLPVVAAVVAGLVVLAGGGIVLSGMLSGDDGGTGGGATSDRLIVGQRTSSGFDLYAVEAGDELSRDSRIASDRRFSRPTRLGAGGTVVTTNPLAPLVAALTSEDDAEVVLFGDTEDDNEVILDRANSFGVIESTADGSYRIIENRDSSARCYIYRRGGEPELIVRADVCQFGPTLDRVLAIDTGDEFEATVTDLEGNDLFRFDSERFPTLMRSGRHVVAIEGDGSVRAVLFDTETGEELAVSDREDSWDLVDSNARGNALLYSQDFDTFDAGLWIITGGGSVARIGSGDFGASGLFVSDDSNHVLVAEYGDETELALFDPATGELDEIAADLVVNAWVPPGVRSGAVAMLVGDDDSAELLVSRDIVDEPLQSLDLDDYARVNRVVMAPDGAGMFVEVATVDFDEQALVFAPFDSVDPYFITDGWSQVRLDDIDEAGRLVITGVEDAGEDEVIAVIANERDARPEVLDEGESISDAGFDRSGNALLYTVHDGDDADVYRVDLDGSRPEIVWRDAEIITTGWRSSLGQALDLPCAGCGE